MDGGAANSGFFLTQLGHGTFDIRRHNDERAHLLRVVRSVCLRVGGGKCPDYISHGELDTRRGAGKCLSGAQASDRQNKQAYDAGVVLFSVSL